MKKTYRCFAVLIMAAILFIFVIACQSQSTETSSSTVEINTSEESSKKAEGGLYTPGIYSAIVTGMKEMTVTVTFSEDAITTIELDHEETPGIGEPVCGSLPIQIIELQGLGIDAVAGATLSSMAILDGVADCVEQAGGDVAALKAVKPQIIDNGDEELTADVVVIGAGGAARPDPARRPPRR